MIAATRTSYGLMQIPEQGVPAVVLEHRGKAMTIRDWSKRLDVEERVLIDRFIAGWAVKDILEKPVRRLS